MSIRDGREFSNIARGPQGADGVVGDSGDQGPTGPTGHKGDRGATGPKGDVGPAGGTIKGETADRTFNFGKEYGTSRHVFKDYIINTLGELCYASIKAANPLEDYSNAFELKFTKSGDAYRITGDIKVNCPSVVDEIVSIDVTAKADGWNPLTQIPYYSEAYDITGTLTFGVYFTDTNYPRIAISDYYSKDGVYSDKNRGYEYSIAYEFEPKTFLSQQVDSTPEQSGSKSLITSDGVASAFNQLIDIIADAKNLSEEQRAEMKAIYN